MGVLPLEFKPGVNRTTLGHRRHRNVRRRSASARRARDLTLVIHRRDGERVDVPVTCRLDTAEECIDLRSGRRAAALRAGLS
jgi:aconitase A